MLRGEPTIRKSGTSILQERLSKASNYASSDHPIKAMINKQSHSETSQIASNSYGYSNKCAPFLYSRNSKNESCRDISYVVDYGHHCHF